MKRGIFFGLILAGVFTGAESDADNQWHLTGDLYLWGAGISGTTRGGGDIDVELSDILDNLEFAFMAGLEARKAKWSLSGDFIYLDVAANRSGSLTDVGLVTVTADVGVEGLVVNLLAGYDLASTDRGSAKIVFGARYLDVDATLKVSITAPVQTPGLEFLASEDVWDAVIGLKGGIGLSKSFYIPWYLDVGAGESDLTWQAIIGVAWRPRWGEIALGYRHIDWDFESGSLMKDIGFSGPGLLFRFHFF